MNKAHVYIAARISRRPECHALAHKLIGMGFVITSTWVKTHLPSVPHTGPSEQASDEERQRIAQQDYIDLNSADVVISLTEEARSSGRGGRHVEFGMGVALGKKMIVIGPQETVFHHLPGIAVFKDVDTFIGWLKAEMKS